MGIYVNPGNEGFQSALRSEIYVDKTEILEELNSVIETEQRCVCVSRPRRFGKSMTANMLLAYYGKGCDSREIFENLKIAKKLDFEKNLNQYNIIYADMNDFLFRRDYQNGDTITAKMAIALFQKEVIKELKQQFKNADMGMENDLPLALTNINNIYKEKFIIIIDEWDAIFREDKNNIEAQKEYIELFRGLFKNANSQKFLALAYITGILPIKKYGTESALNNFREFTMINPKKLAKYVGFTEEEVIALCQRYHMDFSEAQKWYDGYSFRRAMHVYNPNSIVNAMLDEEYGNYWTRTETFESLKSYISMNFDGLKDAIVQMLAGFRCKIDTDTFENDFISFANKDDVLTVLVHLGYLAYDNEKKEVYIPNEEVRSAFVSAVKKSDWKPMIQAIDASEQLLLDTWRQNEKAVAGRIDEVHMQNTSILSYNDENSLSGVISLAYYNAINEYTLIRELPTGRGYADIVFLPRPHSDKPAMIVELKYNKSPNSAIAQIEEKKYSKALEAYKGNLLLVGINYDEKTKSHQCRIKQIQK